MPKETDFDDYADRYEDLLKEQLAFFSKDRSYFSEYKAEIAAGVFHSSPISILDFGCGIGLSLPSLLRHFPNAKFYASDLSEKSLAYVHDTFFDVTVLPDEELDDNCFDMIFVSGVFHHVPAILRTQVIKRLATLLTRGGRLIVFEHNPFNPVTRHMVSTCPFDADALLISLNGMKQLIRDVAGLDIPESGYCLFFPQVLQGLRPLEKLMRWFPLGGQYFVVGSK